MRRLKTRLEMEKSDRKKRLIVGGILIFLMLFSTAGFALNGIANGGNNGNPKENAYHNGQYWVYLIGNQEFYFTSQKNDIEKAEFNFDKTLSDYQGSNLYVDSENFEITREISVNLGRYTQRFQEACYGSCERDLPEKDCSENLIVWRDNDQNLVSQENNCIFIDGDLDTVDSFLYEILSIN